jgi:Xaa-Pro aminopeptidase
MMQWWVKPGMTERAIAGAMTAVWMENGCERPSYAPIVGSGINSTTLHYSANDRTMQDGDVLLVDAACEYSMYAADITRTVPVNGHFTPRQREIYNIVLGAQQAAIDAFVAGKSTINDRDRRIRTRSTPWPTTTSTPTERICTASRSASIGCMGWAT